MNTIKQGDKTTHLRPGDSVTIENLKNITIGVNPKDMLDLKITGEELSKDIVVIIIEKG